jgi:hypothetical protein
MDVEYLTGMAKFGAALMRDSWRHHATEQDADQHQKG